MPGALTGNEGALKKSCLTILFSAGYSISLAPLTILFSMLSVVNG